MKKQKAKSKCIKIMRIVIFLMQMKNKLKQNGSVIVVNIKIKYQTQNFKLRRYLYVRNAKVVNLKKEYKIVIILEINLKIT